MESLPNPRTWLLGSFTENLTIGSDVSHRRWAFMDMENCNDECIAKSCGCIHLFFWFAKATISHFDRSGNVGHGRALRCLPYASEISHIESRSSYDQGFCIRFLATLMTYIRSRNRYYEPEIRMRRSIKYCRQVPGLLREGTGVPYALSPNRKTH